MQDLSSLSLFYPIPCGHQLYNDANWTKGMEMMDEMVLEWQVDFGWVFRPSYDGTHGCLTMIWASDIKGLESWPQTRCNDNVWFRKLRHSFCYNIGEP